MNILAYDNNVYLVNLDKNNEDVYIVNIKQGVIQGYDNIHKIMRFGNYSIFDNDKLTNKLKDKMTDILRENGIGSEK